MTLRKFRTKLQPQTKTSTCYLSGAVVRHP